MAETTYTLAAVLRSVRAFSFTVATITRDKSAHFCHNGCISSRLIT